MFSQRFEMSPDALELLRQKETRSYVVNKLRQSGVVMTWEDSTEPGYVVVRLNTRFSSFLFTSYTR